MAPKTIEQVKSQNRQPFGPAIVSHLTMGMKAYPSRFGGGKSCKVLEVAVPIVSAGLSVTCAIYGNFNPTEDGHKIVFSASMPKGVRGLDDTARERLLAHAEHAAAADPQWETLMAKAEAALLGVDAPADDEIVRPKLARLVGKSGETVAVATVNATA